ncbi:MAG: transcription elongation factor GreA [Candidatus Colwellbacteria bacterium]|nr:transcription elongation factor GreA [Candidatus Colwellbacteria bacterium]
MNYHLSAERLNELRKELERLKTEERLVIADRLKRAKEYGDLSENAEYADAREDQSRLEARIEELEDIIKNAVMLEAAVKRETIQIGSTVEVVRDHEDSVKKFAIVGEQEAQPENGKISTESPLGRELIGKKAGDAVTVRLPVGSAVYRIVKVE